MVVPAFFPDSDVVLVADASTAINLCASGRPREILRALPNQVVVLDVVLAELEHGRAKGREDGPRLNEIVSEGLVEVVRLGERGMAEFEGLVIGPATETLEDGEAATIAYALETRAFPLIDEHKANRLCARRFPSLRLGCTLDVFAHPEVGQSLGTGGLATAVFTALQRARMQVPSSRLEWTVNLIGPMQAIACSSLPMSVRNRLVNNLRTA